MGRDECPPYSHPEWPHPLNDSYGPPRGWENGHTKSEWTIIMFMVAIAFACLMFLTAAFLYYQYVRRHDAGESRRRRRLRNSSREAEQNFLASFTEGLGGTMVDALPVFVYTPENFKDGLRCAVCLCEFQQSEKGRLLPSCNHSFHVDCIGMWFYSHSTCPLCRTKVEKQSDASVELGHRQMEASVVEEVEEEGGGGEKVVLGSTSSSPEAEQHYNGGVKQKDDDICDHSKEGNGDHVFIDLEHQRKLTSSSITS